MRTIIAYDGEVWGYRHYFNKDGKRYIATMRRLDDMYGSFAINEIIDGKYEGAIKLGWIKFTPQTFMKEVQKFIDS